jgi:Fe-S-cluster containining protein
MIDNTCAVYNERPGVCSNYTPDEETCGSSFEEAMFNILELEYLTGSAE